MQPSTTRTFDLDVDQQTAYDERSLAVVSDEGNVLALRGRCAGGQDDGAVLEIDVLHVPVMANDL